ncbi:hypothetical protein NFI96_014713, partial [Prochilodus magdalenae]
MQAYTMAEDFTFTFPSVLHSLLGLILFLGDVVLDVWNIVSLYQNGDYVYVGVLIALLLASSILAQVYSWMWYSDHKCQETSVEIFASQHSLIGPLHVLQLGIFLRFAGVVETSIRKQKQNISVQNCTDMSMLRLFEAFSESAPQLIILITITIQKQELQLLNGLKIAASLGAIASCLLSYHRDMRAFVKEEDQKMGWSSSAVFFLWNLFLIAPRVLAIALFTSILPFYIAVHFLCWWLLLFLWACSQKTDFMDTKGSEWLYRATVGLIWYFSWFNVSSGRTMVKNIIYHTCMVADLGLLLGLWFWKSGSVESACLGPLCINPDYVLIGGLPALYVTGLLLKLLYYCKFHPNHPHLITDVKDEIEVVLKSGSCVQTEYVLSDTCGCSGVQRPDTMRENFLRLLLSVAFPLGGLLLFLLDVVLDIWTVVSLYQTGQYVYMGLLIALLLCSSVLVHTFSWMFYVDTLKPPDLLKPDSEDSEVDNWKRCIAKRGLIRKLHILQLGMFFRFTVFIWKLIILKKKKKKSGYIDQLMMHDLRMLGLFETFSESIPQLVLMLTLVMQEQELQLFTGFKIAGSLASICCSLLSYHIGMRKLRVSKQKMKWTSSAAFFLWNLFLIVPRVLAVALFASVLPSYISVHFLCWWVLLFICACIQKTDLMENKGGEWLYRATVGLIWYFSWYNVSKGKTRITSTIYHACMMVDMALLLGLWFWKRSVESARLGPLCINPYVLIGGLPVLYVIGLLLKLLYYWKFHPRVEEDMPDKADGSNQIFHKRAAAADSSPDSSGEAEPA